MDELKLATRWKKSERAADAFMSFADKFNLPERVEINTKSNEAEFFFYAVFDPTTAEQVAQAMAAIGADDPITVRINSPGGNAFSGMAIYSALSNHAGPVTVHIDGVAASAASVVAMAGDKIIIQPSGMMMVHKAWSVVAGNADELRADAAVMDKLDAVMMQVYAKRTNTDPSIWLDILAAETWYSSSEALKANLVHEITEPPKVKKTMASVEDQLLIGQLAFETETRQKRLLALRA